MGLILSIDLAYRKARDFGACLLEEMQGQIAKVSFLAPSDLKLEDPPNPKQCAGAIFDFCGQHGVRIVFLDGPQGWKDPHNGLEHARVAERILYAPAKSE